MLWLHLRKLKGADGEARSRAAHALAERGNPKAVAPLGAALADRSWDERASAAIMQICIAAGGSITGEHGVGSDKLRYMASIFDADTLTAMREVRRVFDPAQLSNPGKVVPLHACREWWATPAARPRTRAEATT